MPMCFCFCPRATDLYEGIRPPAPPTSNVCAPRTVRPFWYVIARYDFLFLFPFVQSSRGSEKKVNLVCPPPPCLWRRLRNTFQPIDRASRVLPFLLHSPAKAKLITSFKVIQIKVLLGLASKTKQPRSLVLLKRRCRQTRRWKKSSRRFRTANVATVRSKSAAPFVRTASRGGSPTRGGPSGAQTPTPGCGRRRKFARNVGEVRPTANRRRRWRRRRQRWWRKRHNPGRQLWRCSTHGGLTIVSCWASTWSLVSSFTS